MTKRSDFQLPVRTSIDADARVIAWDPTDTNGEPFVVPVSAVAASASLTDLFVRTAETGATSAEVMFGTRVTGDAQNRLEITADGSIKQGDGTVAPVLPIDDQQWAVDDAVGTLLRHEADGDATLGASGRTQFTHFRANRNISARNIEIVTTGTAAGATPTLVKVGLYSVGMNGDLTLLSQSANQTLLFAATNLRYRIPLTASVPIVRGTMYALAVLVVSGATLPTLSGQTVNGIEAGFVSPVMTTRQDGQTDLAATLTRSAVVSSNVSNGSRVRGILKATQGFATFDGVNDTITTPDAAALDVSTAVEMVVRVRYLNTSDTPALISKDQSTWAYGLQIIATSGQVRFRHGGDGTTPVNIQSNADLAYGTNVWFWLKVTWRASDGRTQFFHAADQAFEPTVWTQLGTDVTGQSGVNIPNNANPLYLGTRAGFADLLSGDIARAIVRGAIDGAPVLDFNPTAYVSGTTFPTVTGQVMTLASGATISERTETT